MDDVLPLEDIVDEANAETAATNTTVPRGKRQVGAKKKVTKPKATKTMAATAVRKVGRPRKHQLPESSASEPVASSSSVAGENSDFC